MCAQTKLSPSHTVDLYSPLFDLRDVALHPTWLDSVECQSVQVCADSRLRSPRSGLLCSFLNITFNISAFSQMWGACFLIRKRVFFDAVLKIPGLQYLFCVKEAFSFHLKRINPFSRAEYKHIFSENVSTLRQVLRQESVLRRPGVFVSRSQGRKSTLSLDKMRVGCLGTQGFIL